MSTLVSRKLKSDAPAHTATNVRFVDSMLYISLSDGREIGVPISHFRWLANATTDQRAKWHIEPRGIAIYWDELDDGIEVDHLME
jgi:hypothetical protein